MTFARRSRTKASPCFFRKPALRTRVSFEVAMTELGGHALFLDWQSSNFILTDLAYEIEYLSRNVQVIMARLLHNSDFLNHGSGQPSPDDQRLLRALPSLPSLNRCAHHDRAQRQAARGAAPFVHRGSKQCFEFLGFDGGPAWVFADVGNT